MERQDVSRPCVQDLTFQMFDRPVHPELIDSLVVQSFRRDGYRLKLHLTAAGHLFEWCWQDLTLVEVLTEQSHPLPEGRQMFAHRVGGERNECFWPRDSISYHTCFQAEKLPPEVFFHIHDELRSDGEKDGVLHVLRPQDRLGLSPISFVDLQARKNSLIVHVYHTFPEEFAVVKSQTLIEIAQ